MVVWCPMGWNYDASGHMHRVQLAAAATASAGSGALLTTQCAIDYRMRWTLLFR